MTPAAWIAVAILAVLVLALLVRLATVTDQRDAALIQAARWEGAAGHYQTIAHRAPGDTR